MSFAFSCRNQCGKRMVGIIGMGHYMFFNPCVSFGILVSSWMKCLSVGNFLCPLSSCYSLWFPWINFLQNLFIFNFLYKYVRVYITSLIWRPICHILSMHAYLYVPYPVFFFQLPDWTRKEITSVKWANWLGWCRNDYL